MLDQRREVSVQPEPGTDDGEHRLDARDGKLARVENGNDLSRVAVLSQVGLDLGGGGAGEVFKGRRGCGGGGEARGGAGAGNTGGGGGCGALPAPRVVSARARLPI